MDMTSTETKGKAAERDVVWNYSSYAKGSDLNITKDGDCHETKLLCLASLLLSLPTFPFSTVLRALV